MQKILPDTSFLAQWRDKIEAVVITHGRVTGSALVVLQVLAASAGCLLLSWCWQQPFLGGGLPCSSFWQMSSDALRARRQTLAVSSVSCRLRLGKPADAGAACSPLLVQA